ncbi:hypothetical protein, partial [Xanthomonas phaseoli]
GRGDYRGKGGTAAQSNVVPRRGPQYVTDAFWPNTSSGLSSSFEFAVDKTEAAAKLHTSRTQQCGTLFNDSRFPIPDSQP